MKRIFGLASLLALAACTHPPSASSDKFGPCSPIGGLDNPDLPVETRRTVQEAQEDFCAVLANREPIYAKRVGPPWGTKERGNKYYAGRGYSLVMYLDTFEVGGGYMGFYGRILHFDSNTGVPGPSQLSQVRIVSLPPVY